MRHHRLALLVSASLGCTAARPPAAPPALDPDAARFPTPAELTAIADAPAPALASSAVDVPTWELAGPFPDLPPAGSASGPAPWGALLDAGAAAGAFSPTASAHCVARELGRFHLRHQAQPTERLRALIDGWCGNTALSADVRFYGGAVPADIDDDEVWAQWREPVAALIGSLQPASGGLGGIWYGRDHGRAVIAIVRAVPWVSLEPATTAPAADNIVTVRGTVQVPVTEVRVMASRGALGVTTCALEPGIALPAFAARCPVEAPDATAWIEVAAVPPGGVLGKVVARVLARRPAAIARYALGLPVADASDPADGEPLTALLNRVRTAAGLPALVVEAEQSALASRLAPHFFAAVLGGDRAGTGDRISLGLMAGRGVHARVTSADLVTVWTTSERPRALLAAALDSPTGRAVLLDPSATHLAIGDVDGDARVRGGLFVTYHAFPDDIAAGQHAVVARIQAERDRLGNRALQIVPGGRTLERDVAAALDGRESPEAVLSALLTEVTRQTGRAAHGEYAVGSSLAAIPLPDSVLLGGEARALVVAAPYRPAGAAWWNWTAFFIVAEDLQSIPYRVGYKSRR
jgi:hypothetical protein